MEKADYIQMMMGYSNVQKTYTQYAVGALILPVTFLRDVLGVGAVAKEHLNLYLWAGWVGLLVCIASSLIFQTVAAKRIAEFMQVEAKLKNYPRLWFNLATAAFFIGVLCLFVGIVIAQLDYKPKPDASSQNEQPKR